MKKFMKVVAILSFLVISACSKVPAGNVGVKVYLLGGDKGVESEELGVGRYWIGMNEELYLFPTFTQNYVWTKDSMEGSPNDESISFQSKEGMSVDADIGISYHIDPVKVSIVFQKYRKGVEEITDIFLRNMVRDAFVKAAETKEISQIYGSGKSKLVEEAQSLVIEQVSNIGIVVEKIYLVGKLRLPTSIVNSINAKIEATQKTIQRQNEVAQSIAEAQKKVEEAKGNAESQKAMADAESYERRQLAEADAYGLEIKGQMINKYPKILDLTLLEEWDGALSKVSGGVTPFMDVKNLVNGK